MRATICSFVFSCGDTLIDSFTNQMNPDQYLSTSGIESDRSYHSETESLAFCYLFNLDLYVYSNTNAIWFRYPADLQSPPPSRYCIYLQRNRAQRGMQQERFEPVMSVSTGVAMERFSNTDVVNLCDAQVLFTTQTREIPSHIFHDIPDDVESSKTNPILSNDGIEKFREPKISFQSVDTTKGIEVEC